MTDPKSAPDSYVPDLTNYVINFIGDPGKIKFSDAVPVSICPYLLHTCLSYVYTFSRGGTFPWVENGKNENKVFVQCPNPKDGVAASVSKENDGIFARITAIKGSCSFGHKIGDRIRITPVKDIKVPLAVIDACFAWLTYLEGRDDGGSLLSPEMTAEDGGKKIIFCLEKYVPGGAAVRPYHRPCSKLEMSERLGLRLSSFKYRCSYFKWPKRDHYDNDNLGPRGLCIDLFHLSHMYAMGGIYAYRKGDGRFILSCSDKEACVRLSVHAKKTKTYLLRKSLILLLRLFGIKKQIPNFICELTVEEGGERCPMKLKKGMKFIYNTSRKYELCPASFDNLYPIVHNVLRGGRVPWRWYEKGADVAACPDDVSDIVFKFQQDRDD